MTERPDTAERFDEIYNRRVAERREGCCANRRICTECSIFALGAELVLADLLDAQPADAHPTDAAAAPQPRADGWTADEVWIAREALCDFAEMEDDRAQDQVHSGDLVGAAEVRRQSGVARDLMARLATLPAALPPVDERANRDTWDSSCSECGMGNEYADQHAPDCSAFAPLPGLPEGIACGECGDIRETGDHIHRLARYLLRRGWTPPAARSESGETP